MKQKKMFLALAASAMIAAGFTSCSVDDKPLSEPVIPFPVVDNFDEGSEIQNGSCEGSLADNFWCHEWRTSAAQFDGTANIVNDPANPKNHCCAVVVRSQDEALEAGNMVADGDHIAGWDSQFFITLGPDKVLNKNDKLRLTMKVKADVAQDGIDTQSHAAPGAYLHYTAVGNINFTTEWTTFDSGEIQVLESPNWTGGIKAGSYTIALNLSKGIHNTYYFDDIRVEVVRVDPLDEGNAVKNGSFEYGPDFSAYWCHEWRTSEAQFDGQANVIVDPANEKNHCAAVVVRSQDEALAAGNMVADGDHIAGWDSQFFITFGENQALQVGDKLHLKMKIKADVAQDGVATQSHKAPGAYIHWYCLDNVNFTTEWTEFDKEVEVGSGGSWGKAEAGMYTIAFNLSNGQHNTFYFDDIQVLITKAE